MDRNTIFLFAILLFIIVNVFLFTRETSKYNYQQHFFTEKAKQAFQSYLLEKYFKKCPDGYTLKFKESADTVFLQFNSFTISVADTYGNSRKGVVKLDSIINGEQNWWSNQPLFLQFDVDSTGNEKIQSFFDQSYTLTESLVFYKTGKINCNNK